MTKLIICLACQSALLLSIPAASWGGDSKASSSEQESKLIAILKSSATPFEKAEACRELARIGTSAAVKPLSELLGDEKLSHMARYGLEPIPDPAVDEALRDAAGKLTGRALIGVIGSIGVRRDAKAVELLANRLKDSDAGVMRAAAHALGSIGTPQAAKALEDILASDSCTDATVRLGGIVPLRGGHGRSRPAWRGTRYLRAVESCRGVTASSRRGREKNPGTSPGGRPKVVTNRATIDPPNKSSFAPGRNTLSRSGRRHCFR